MFFLLKNWIKSDKLSFKITKIRIVKEFFSIKWLLSILVLGLSTLVVSASSIKYKSELLSNALVYSDAGLWDKAFNVVSKSSDQILVDLIVWLKLREGLGSKFEYVDFIRENPHWPGMKLLRRQAEKKIYNDHKNNKIQLDESLLVLFSNFAPDFWDVKDDVIVPGHVMRLTLSCDHRIVDGVAGAKFLSTLKNMLESPLMMFC